VQLDQHRYFDVIARSSKRRYRLHTPHGNVRLCWRAQSWLLRATRTADRRVLVAQKLR
jgi:hypothetical protein